MIKLKHYGERSFSYASPVDWNKLDVEVRSLTNLKTVRKKLILIYSILHLHKVACHIL